MLINGDAISIPLASGSIHLAIYSPPYYQLRRYGILGEHGAEETPEEYIETQVSVAREVRRVLRDDGQVWINIGDKYASVRSRYSTGEQTIHGGGRNDGKLGALQDGGNRDFYMDGRFQDGDLLLLPQRLAIALQDDGWCIRAVIPWVKFECCLCIGTLLYIRTPSNGDKPMTIADLLKASRQGDVTKYQLWNGQRWTRILSITKSEQTRGIELMLRSGQPINCTPEHLFPTKRGLVKAEQLCVGDILETCNLPEPDVPICPMYVPDDLGWFVGIYLAEGCKNGNIISIAGHVKEQQRLERLRKIAEAYGSVCHTYRVGKNGTNTNIPSVILAGILDTYVYGNSAKTKRLRSKIWNRSNGFLHNVLMGYLEGDGRYDKVSDRWELGFTRNRYLASDLRVLCARLGVDIRLKNATIKVKGKVYKIHRGKLRLSRKDSISKGTQFKPTFNSEIVGIRPSESRQFFDIAVEDEPHLFALASGVLTHNCLPESVGGTRWERHRVKVRSTSRPLGEANRFDNESKGGFGNIGDRAIWIDCPGCSTCEPNDNLILRRARGRPTVAHEWWIILTKGNYYWDAEAIKKAPQLSSIVRANYPVNAYGTDEGSGGARLSKTAVSRQKMVPSGRRNRRTSDWWNESLEIVSQRLHGYIEHLDTVRANGGLLLDNLDEPIAMMVNPRGFTAVSNTMEMLKWYCPVHSPLIRGQCASEERCTCRVNIVDHYATFPVEMIEPIILACTSQKGYCAKCGAPWVRVVERQKEIQQAARVAYKLEKPKTRGDLERRSTAPKPDNIEEYVTVNWKPTCDCGDTREPVKAIVFDPYVGSGSTLLAARNLQRRGVGMDLNYAYLTRIAMPRVIKTNVPEALEELPLFRKDNNETSR